MAARSRVLSLGSLGRNIIRRESRPALRVREQSTWEMIAS